MALPIDPTGRVLRDLVLLSRLANGIATATDPILRELANELAELLVRFDPTAVGAVRYQRLRVARILEFAEPLIREAYDEWYRVVRRELAAVGREYGRRSIAVLLASLGTEGEGRVRVSPNAPSINMLKAIIDRDPFAGDTLAGWADRQETATLHRFRSVVQLGMMREQPINEIVREVVGEGVRGKALRDATAIVRTAVTDIAATAAFETYRANPSITTHYQYVATLDDRTTPICIALDGQVFEYEDRSAPRPPQHIGCRSTIVPVVDWERLGLRAPPPGMRAARNLRTGKTVFVPASWDFGRWLREQPPEVQDRVLGKGVAELWRRGDITLRDLISGRGNKPLTLKQLRQRAARRHR